MPLFGAIYISNMLVKHVLCLSLYEISRLSKMPSFYLAPGDVNDSDKENTNQKDASSKDKQESTRGFHS